MMMFNETGDPAWPKSVEFYMPNHQPHDMEAFCMHCSTPLGTRIERHPDRKTEKKADVKRYMLFVQDCACSDSREIRQRIQVVATAKIWAPKHVEITGSIDAGEESEDDQA